jgi:hypothetical protein
MLLHLCPLLTVLWLIWRYFDWQAGIALALCLLVPAILTMFRLAFHPVKNPRQGQNSPEEF